MGPTRTIVALIFRKLPLDWLRFSFKLYLYFYDFNMIYMSKGGGLTLGL